MMRFQKYFLFLGMGRFFLFETATQTVFWGHFVVKSFFAIRGKPRAGPSLLKKAFPKTLSKKPKFQWSLFFFMFFLCFLDNGPGSVFARPPSHPQREEVRSLYGEGLKLQRQGRHDRAIALFTRCLALTPSFFEGYIALGYSYEKTGEDRKALVQYAKARRFSFPYPHLLLYKEAMIYLRLGEYEKAVRWLRFALVVEPSFREAHGAIQKIMKEHPSLKKPK